MQTVAGLVVAALAAFIGGPFAFIYWLRAPRGRLLVRTLVVLVLVPVCALVVIAALSWTLGEVVPKIPSMTP